MGYSINIQTTDHDLLVFVLISSARKTDEEVPSRGRSGFELSESGAEDLLVDTLQFHIDGFFAMSASTVTKRRSISKIVQTVAAIPSVSLRGMHVTCFRYSM